MSQELAQPIVKFAPSGIWRMVLKIDIAVYFRLQFPINVFENK